jgi:two-component system, sensor histidine kinase and response regulator
VILDAIMPGMDGLELSERIKSDPRFQAPTILMISSADRHALGARIRRSPLAAYLEKPVSQSELLETMLGVLAPIEQPVPATTGEVLTGRERPRLEVLLAEDTPANQKLVISILRKRGHAVTVANNGREAIDLIRQRDFDLVLMDVQMPVMDGFQATAAIRSMEEDGKTRLPIVAMTAHAMREDRERCLRSGMDAYLAKPVDSREMIALVERLARPAGRGLQAEEPAKR